MASNSVNRYFEGLLVGGAVGFIAGILTAPKSGAEMRKELAESAEDLRKVANDQWAEMKDNLSDRVGPLADRADEYRSRFSAQAHDIKDKLADKTTNLRQQANVLKDKVVDTAVDLKNKASDKALQIKEQADDLKEKMLEKDSGAGATQNGKDLVDNFMGNNSGPMYTAGAKANPNLGTHSMGDACSNYEPNLPEAGGG